MPKQNPAAKKRKRATKAVAKKSPRIQRPLKDPFPQTITVTMPYSTSTTLDPSQGLAGAAFFRATSINDPEYALGGHQPYGHDIYQQVYHHYKVISASIEVLFCGTASTAPANPGAVVGITVCADATETADSFHELREQSGTQMKVFSVGGQGTCRVTNGYNSARMFPRIADSDSLNAPFGSNPAENAFFKVWTTGAKSTADPPELAAVVLIRYKVVMWERRDLGQS